MKPKRSMSKAGGRVVGGGPKRGLLIKGKWKAVELDPSLFANEEMGGLVCFEELTEYSLVETERAFLPAEKSPTKKNTEKKKKKKKKKDAEEVEEEEKNEVEEEGKKKQSKKGKKRKASAMTEAKDEEEKAEEEEGEEGMMMMEEKEEELAEPPAKKKKKRQKKKKKNAAEANQGQAESQTGDATGDADTLEQKSTPEEAGTGTEQDSPGTNRDPPGKKKSQAQEKQAGEDKPSVTPKKKNKNKNKKKNKTTAEGAEQTSATADAQTEASSQNPAAEQKKQTQKNKKKEKNKAKEVSPSTAASATGTTQPEKKKKKKQKKKEVKNWTSAALAARGGTAGADVSAWKDLFVPSPVLQALSCLGFAHPTPIQALALPPAIRDHLDVLGAAETGSGKTLSFGIPILHNILEWKQASETWIANKKAEQEAAANQTAEQAAATNEVAEQEGATNELDTEAKEAANGSAQEEDETPPPASDDVTSSSATAAEGNSGKAEEETPAVEKGGEEEADQEGEEKQEVEEEEDQSEEKGEEEEELELQSEDDDDDVEAVDLASEEGDEDDANDEDADDDDDEAAADEDRGCVRIRSVEEGDSHTNAEEKEEEGEGPKQPLLALVLTPTRELAVQVKHHIDAIAQFTGIRTAIVVGGMAPQKQNRVLSRRPEIVIATPGRLWDLIKDGHPHLTDLRHLRSLVIDEADRMVERGHFAELENLLEMLNTSQFNPKRQTFVFSATLTMVHSLPLRVMQKKSKRGQQNPNSGNKLELLMQKVGIRDKPKVIDLTRQQATVETLVETRIQCTKEEKDFYLYYFLSQYPGRTMVFANSIECIKRLSSLLLILDQTPLPLHANMHQKQRLKNLERFAEREHCVLLTTDVAARGLDIPNVQHVIHYQVPRTSETYVHRSGRTARATKQGLSLLLIGPDDLMNYKKIYRTLGKDEDLPTFPVQTRCMAAIKERVKLAWRIEKIEYHNSKQRHHNSWFTQQAEAMDIDLDDDVLMAAGRDQEADLEQQRLVKGLKKQLKHLLGQPVFRNEMKTRYPTQMGKLQLPQLPLATAETALTSLANQKTVRKQWTRKKPNKK